MNMKILQSLWGNKLTRWLTGVLIVSVALFLSIREGLSEDIHGDFYIFWSAGLNFWQGHALYSRIGGAEEFLYPPFAPMVFQLLALLLFQTSAICFTFLNFGLWMLSFRTVAQILRFYFPETNFQSILWFTFFATLRFFWHNIIWVNINELVLTLSLFGVLNYLRGKETASILCFTAGAWLKVMPGLFLLLLAVKGNYKTWVKMTLSSLSVVLLVVVQRGVEQSIQDFQDFFSIVLKPFTEGKVYTDWISFSISSMIFKLLTAHPNVDDLQYHLIDLSLNTVRLISTSLQVIVLGLIVGRILRNRFIRRQKEMSLIEIVTIFLGMLLLAGVSWEGHHVTMVLVYPAIVLLLRQLGKNKLQKITITFCLIVGFMTLDLLGTQLYNIAQGFSVITFLMLYLLVVSFMLKDIYPTKKVST